MIVSRRFETLLRASNGRGQLAPGSMPSLFSSRINQGRKPSDRLSASVSSHALSKTNGKIHFTVHVSSGWSALFQKKLKDDMYSRSLCTWRDFDRGSLSIDQPGLGNVVYFSVSSSETQSKLGGTTIARCTGGLFSLYSLGLRGQRSRLWRAIGRQAGSSVEHRD